MKKTLAALLIIVLITSNVFAFQIKSNTNEYFSNSQRYSIRNLDTNGEMFVGVYNDMAIRSSDFQNWERIDDVKDVATIQYVQNRFNAVGAGFTYTSADGINWEKQINNLPAVPNDGDYIIKNKDSVVIFVYGSGTFQSFDCINWKKVENIPEGIRMNIVNGKIMFFSDGYMRGLYYSETGESFTHVEIQGFKESYGGNHINYKDGEYLIEDYWTSVEDEAYCTVWYSTDLNNWSSRLEPRPQFAANHGSFVEINGEIYEFSINGYGKYDMTDGMYRYEDGRTSIPPFVYYNFTDYGVFGWSTNHFSYFVANDGTMLKYDGRELKITRSYVEDNVFYAETANGTVWKSESGEHWKKTDKIIEEQRIIKNSGTNGQYTLTSEFIERGSQAGRDINKEITAEITYDDGTTAKVAYEYAKDDYVKIISGNGYFLLGGFSINDGWYYSRDGITREFEILGLPSSRDSRDDNLIANDKYYMFFGNDFGNIYYGELSQLEQFNNAQQNVRVKLNDEYLSFAAPPVIQNDRTLIPIRFLFERAGAEVIWNHEKYSVTINYGDTTVNLAIDDDTAYVNGVAKKLDVPARLINDKTMIPLRFISEELGFNVNWNEAEYTAEVIF